MLICLLAFSGNGMAQLMISGTVYDSSKIIPVKGVLVKSNNGSSATTDSAGHYTIVTNENDSLHFFYNDKPTIKFPVNKIENYDNFDISLRIRVNDKYKALKEVQIFSKSYKQDSIENRQQYAKIFDYSKPGISTTSSSYSGTPGMDLDEFINMFRFKRNKQYRKMQERLIEEEEEKYIDYRFNKNTVRRITGFDGTQLVLFMQKYRPGFAFTQSSNTVDFYQYILNASYEFKRDLELKK